MLREQGRTGHEQAAVERREENRQKQQQMERYFNFQANFSSCFHVVVELMVWFRKGRQETTRVEQ